MIYEPSNTYLLSNLPIKSLLKRPTAATVIVLAIFQNKKGFRSVGNIQSILNSICELIELRDFIRLIFK